MPESIFMLHRLRAAGGRGNGDGVKKTRSRDRAIRAIPALEANAELQANVDVCQRIVSSTCSFLCQISKAFQLPVCVDQMDMVVIYLFILLDR